MDFESCRSLGSTKFYLLYIWFSDLTCDHISLIKSDRMYKGIENNSMRVI